MKKSISLFLLMILGLLIVAILLYNLLPFWLSNDFSPEVDAAILTAVVTIPLTLFSIVATVGISTIYNSKTIQLTKQQHRAGIRDIYAVKKLDAYTKLIQLVAQTETQLYHTTDTKELKTAYRQFLQELTDFYHSNYLIVSEAVAIVVKSILYINNRLTALENQEFVLARKVYKGLKEIHEEERVLQFVRKKEKKSPEAIQTLLKSATQDFHSFSSILSIIPPDWCKQKLGVDIPIQYSEGAELFLAYRLAGYFYTDALTEKEEPNQIRKNLLLLYKHIKLLTKSELEFKTIQRDINLLRTQDNSSFR